MVGLEPPKNFVHTCADLASKAGMEPDLFRQRRQDFMELLSFETLYTRVKQLVAVEEDKVRDLDELVVDTNKKSNEKRHLVELVRRWDLCLEVTVMELELLRSAIDERSTGGDDGHNKEAGNGRVGGGGESDETDEDFDALEESREPRTP
jgi:hypothetical protein